MASDQPEGRAPAENSQPKTTTIGSRSNLTGVLAATAPSRSSPLRRLSSSRDAPEREGESPNAQAELQQDPQRDDTNDHREDGTEPGGSTASSLTPREHPRGAHLSSSISASSGGSHWTLEDLGGNETPTSGGGSSASRARPLYAPATRHPRAALSGISIHHAVPSLRSSSPLAVSAISADNEEVEDDDASVSADLRLRMSGMAPNQGVVDPTLTSQSPASSRSSSFGASNTSRPEIRSALTSPSPMPSTSRSGRRNLSRDSSALSMEDSDIPLNTGPLRLQRSSSTAGIFDLDEPSASASSKSSQTSSASGTAGAFATFIDPLGARTSLSTSASAAAQHAGATAPGQSQLLSPSPESSRRSSARLSLGPPVVGSSSPLSAPLAAPVMTSQGPTASSSVGHSKTSRAPLDTTPSFSSPLAYASILPSEHADDLDLDHAVESTSPRIPSQEADVRDSLATSEQQDDSLADLSSTPASPKRERSASAKAKLMAHARDWQPIQGLSSNTPVASRAASVTAFGTTGSAPSSISTSPDAVSGSLSRSARRKSALSPGAPMGPPAIVPRKASAPTRSSEVPPAPEPSEPGAAHVQRARTIQSSAATSRVAAPAKGEDPNNLGLGLPSPSNPQHHKDSGSSAPPSAWDPRHTMHAGESSKPSVSGGITGTRRRRSSAANLSANAHRRARSLGGALLGSDVAAAVGGPDGVDPNLVAAIRAGDASIPRTPSAAPHDLAAAIASATATPSDGTPPSSAGTVAGSVAATHSSPSHASASTSPRMASLPSTPSGSLRMTNKRLDLLNVMPDTRALATSYPSMQMPATSPRPPNPFSSHAGTSSGSPDSEDSRISPTAPLPPSSLPMPSSASKTKLSSSMQAQSPLNAPSDYVRSRVRSQTLASPRSAQASLSGAAPAGAANLAAPLGEAIRLQRMPTAVRMANDLNLPPSPSISRAGEASVDHLSMSLASLPSLSESQTDSHSVDPLSRLGLGIGLHPASEARMGVQPPVSAGAHLAQTVNAGLTSPSSSSGRSSPVVSRRNTNQEIHNAPRPSPNMPATSFSREGGTIRSPGSAPTQSARLGLSGSADRPSGSAFAPLLSIPPMGETRKHDAVAIEKSSMPDLGYSFDTISRPAPWIASSQDSKPHRSLHGKAALTARPSSSHGRTHLELPAVPYFGSQNRMSFAGPPSGPIRPAASPSASHQLGIDEYARIIVQSRNAKMQKWRSTARSAVSPPASAGLQTSPLQRAMTDGMSTYPSGRYTTLEGPQQMTASSVLRRQSTLTLRQQSDGIAERQRSVSVSNRQAPDPRAGPANALSSSSAQSSVQDATSPPVVSEFQDPPIDEAGKEIEWVDWLDEYRRLKEAKLRSQRASHPPEATPAKALTPVERTPSEATSLDQAVLQPAPNVSPQLELASMDTRGSFAETTSPGAGGPSLPDPRSRGQPRRPSELSRFSQQRVAREPSRSMSLGQSLGIEPRSSQPPISQGLSHAPSPRNLSLSPITSRLVSAGSTASSSTGTDYAPGFGSSSGRRKRNLGSKIEAWWGAVKSGFVGAQPSPPQSAASVGTPSFYERNMTPGHNEAPRASGFSRLAPQTTSPTTSTHLRSFTTNPRPHSDMRSVHTLRPSSSAQNLKASEASQEPTPSGQNSSATSAGQPKFDEALPETQLSDRTSSHSGSRPRRQMKLSLNLEAGLSSFNADAFDGIPGTRASDSSSTAPGSAASKPLTSGRPEPPSSDRSHFSDRPSSPKGTRALSENWGHSPKAPPRHASTPPRLPEVQTSAAREELSAVGASSPSSSAAMNVDDSGKNSAGSKDMTMTSIRQHIRHRLAASKDSCDKELRKIIGTISEWVEDSLAEKEEDNGQVEEGEGATSPSATPDAQGIFNSDVEDLTLGLDRATLSEPPPSTSAIDPGLCESAGEMTPASCTAIASPSALSTSATQDGTVKGASDPSETSQGPMQYLMQPMPRRPGGESASISMLAQQNYRLSSPPAHPLGAASSPQRSNASHALSRSRSRDVLRSVSASRSTSRSHSPMPQTTDSPQLSPARRIRPLFTEDPPLEPYIPALQEIVSLAMEVVNTSIEALASRTGACSEIISKVQTVGRVWDEHPDWPGRGWYVRLLLAVAGLSRVVEWWEAEKGFWNFEDENELQGGETIRFILGEGGDAPGTTHDSATTSTNPLHSPLRVRGVALPPSSEYSSSASSPALEPLTSRRVVSESDRSRLIAAHLAQDQAAEQQTRQTTEEEEKIVTLQAAAETSNVLIELSLDDETLLYVSPAWRIVVGSDPSDVLDRPIADLLAPGDVTTFAEAREQLQVNDSHTVEAAFRLKVDRSMVQISEGEDEATDYYQEMEGKGMLMRDRQSGQASHTMWVFKPMASPEPKGDLSPRQQKASSDAGEPPAVVDPAIAINTDPLLCRICERDVPTWFFEKHSEICNEVHRLEMEIGESNEALSELIQVVKSISSQMEVMSGDESNANPIEYRGVPIITPHPSNVPPSALEIATRAISPRHPHAASVRKQHLRALDSLLEALRSAVTISTPAVKEDVAEQPIEKQRLLSPESEGKVGHARNWRRPTVEDGGLDTLAMDVESAIKVKISAVTRMLNTIIYVETVRQEWEARVEAALADAEGSDTDGASDQSSRGADEQAAGVNETAMDRVHDLSAALEVSEPDSNEDEEDGHTSGILLERDDRGLPSFSSSEPSPSPGVGDDDDIPGVESQMGGVADAHASPIPISGGSDNGATQSEEAPKQAQSRRKSVNTTSTLQTRRMSTLSQPGVVHTPPLSPRQLPELAGSAGKVRRISMSQRNSPQLSASAAVSPRLPPMAPSSRPTASSIKDFDILKPISKGAFGSVFLAKKRTTGDYYAIKVLKKSDMIAKNQIRNVKAERMILMTQTQSPFVVKLFFTFQSAEYLYLVMEYLPGGDCASLCKALGGLPEEWARIFVAEVVIGLEQLHKQGVVHRDMKPDNLLIDQKGHLKLTDFGLSKYGLLGRQTRGTMRPHHGRPSEGRHAKDDSTGSGSASGSASGSGFGPGSLPTSATSVGTPLSRNGSQKLSSPWRAVASPTTPGLSNVVQSQAFYTAPLRGRIISDAGSSTVSETTHDAPASRRDLDSPAAPRNKIVPVPSSALLESPGQIFGSNALAESFQALTTNSGGSGQPLKKFVGTPDYLAPESILGIGMDDMAVDWWAVGVILYEFLYGYPPFHAETPEKVFDNILSRNIDWEDGAMDYSPSARNLMERLMSSDPKDRLGTRGADEIKAHPFFTGIDWQALSDGEGPFVPQVTDPESTDYFDLRGAVHQEFSGEIERSRSEGVRRDAFSRAIESKHRSRLEANRPASRLRNRLAERIRTEQQQGPDEFGSFSYKNLPVLKQANDEVIRKMRGDQLPALTQALEQPLLHARHRSLSGKHGRGSVGGSQGASRFGAHPGGPPSPSNSASSQGSGPSRSTAPTSPAAVQQAHAGSKSHRRLPSELIASSPGSGNAPSSSGLFAAGNQASSSTGMDRRRSQLAESVTDGNASPRRISLPLRLHTDLLGSPDRPSLPTNWRERRQAEITGIGEGPAASVEDALVSSTAETVTCLVAEDNPISLRMLESILRKLGCQCSTVRNGAEAVRLAMGDVKYAVLFVDVSLPIVNGQDVARMVKSTRNINSSTPIVALASFDRDTGLNASGSVFDAVLAKPLELSDVCEVLPRLGFTKEPPRRSAGSMGSAVPPSDVESHADAAEG
ncbi:hypothetical protein IE81DRAFT_313263 [Ceraceosorus guamensis]|uniref:non-specific serine/threonine protein kinase n=1 Tax=Ceraceosorus guamensis TaxID=1522189 RepID=A0A316VZD9_9BASI|nr:hypothetical protein IE81DRAFT_313263 [Ceraceosorus guamensis]PWN42674.1 hypothetical protein IE81DRAFT_313263 [Ceraceosorus guamensis]